MCVCVNEETRVSVSRKEGICVALNELEICVRRILSGWHLFCKLRHSAKHSHTDIIFLCRKFLMPEFAFFSWDPKCVTSPGPGGKLAVCVHRLLCFCCSKNSLDSYLLLPTTFTHLPAFQKGKLPPSIITKTFWEFPTKSYVKMIVNKHSLILN